ncbi:hypothetical protein AWC03_09235 [Mycobacterium europaeum]|uniref:PPE family protein n=1 Tax=Mycobacterium europaeum TaxID=761804 RepID=UPI000A166573|nr:PPE family protein [Mycobacterium europaeum]ORV61797.1 hypothetical protein AWC03_09235 [Mycobacterium europaeum]
MSAPIWMAFPPEAHSTLLSSGPGPASLFTAAAAWSAMSGEYASAAEELSAVLASTQSGAWEGPSAESYTAAHAPYLAWLAQASAHSAAAAAQLDTAGTAYTAALAAMPTLPEIGANHAVHGALVATNFFGINTIPIAVNEADYVRMWVQAASTMTTYEAVSAAAVAATPRADPAPPILNSDATAAHDEDDDHHGHEHGFDSPLNQFVAQILRLFGLDWDPVEGTLNGLPYEAYTNPGDLLWWVVRTLELFSDFQQFGALLQENPAAAFEFITNLVLFDWPTHLAQLASWLPAQPQVLLVPMLVAVAPLGALTGFVGLAGLAPPPTPVAAPPAPTTAAAPSPTAVLGTAPIAASTAVPAPASAPVPGPTASTVVSPALPTPPAPGTAPFMPPYAIAPPGIGFGSAMRTSAAAGAKRYAAEPDSATATATSAARKGGRVRRRQQARQRGHGDEFMDMNVDVDPDWDGPSTRASEHGAGDLGFAGIARNEPSAAAGLTTLVDDQLGGGPSMPMVPGTWAAADGGTAQDNER